jgi:MoaA/NifB/PqqE/SkfB family radical SAM enzyme
MVIINSIDNVNLILKSLKDRKLENCVVVVTTTHKNKDNVSNMIKSLGYGFWFNIFNYVTFKLRF